MLDKHAEADSQQPPSKTAIERIRIHEHLEALREQNLTPEQNNALNVFLLEGSFSTSSTPTGKFSEAAASILAIALRDDDAGTHARRWIAGIHKQRRFGPSVRAFLTDAMQAIAARELAEDLQNFTAEPPTTQKRPNL